MQVPKTSASQQAASPKTVSQLQLSSLPALATPGQIKGKLGYLARSMMAIRYSFQPEKFAGLAFSQLPAPSSQLPAPSSRVVVGRKRRVSSSGSVALYLVRSTLESSPAASANARLPGSDCLACRLTGFAAMSGLGAYSFVEAYRMGILRRSPLPAGVKARPLWAATLVVFGVGCIGAGVVRLGI
ncbi:hypothetical protein NDA10_003928 [Ustilago hordei]|uniref:DUF4536 domain-containing protein n=1 Tax=Ustilago hordei TaxID=120017 RepID=I2FU83_USTHO|nr:uncharacterized protein UHO2_04887 [Ustilago hordei]KAJ1043152.1 hypothetical protein NDA10_003928 [Ustilago hordei]UTT89395.1 hypothetical protein NDA17_000263 [Ustilago hordei]CCF50476.1 uncharacterized protein UHOR_14456 [Ustilago hordei]SYW82970.1 uncharacterized protein UHO2_04887 [Ustilago hordei]